MRKYCLICFSKNLNKILKLGTHPYADTFISKNKLSKKEPMTKLEVDMCKNCGCIQTSHSTSTFRDIIYIIIPIHLRILFFKIIGKIWFSFKDLKIDKKNSK